MKERIGILLLAVIGMVGCQAKSEESSSEGAAKAAPSAQVKANGDTVEIDGPMLANVKLERVRQESLPRVLTSTGKIQVNEDQVARVLAPLPGQVQDLRVRVGDVIEKDSVLFRIKSREVAGLVTDLMQAQR